MRAPTKPSLFTTTLAFSCMVWVMGCLSFGVTGNASAGGGITPGCVIKPTRGAPKELPYVSATRAVDADPSLKGLFACEPITNQAHTDRLKKLDLYYLASGKTYKLPVVFQCRTRSSYDQGTGRLEGPSGDRQSILFPSFISLSYQSALSNHPEGKWCTDDRKDKTPVPCDSCELLGFDDSNP